VSVHTVEVRLVPNPALYALRAPLAVGPQFGALKVADVKAQDGALSVVATAPHGGLPTKEVLQLLDYVHRHLERAGGAPVAGTP
jgi:hypothetical protein